LTQTASHLLHVTKTDFIVIVIVVAFPEVSELDKTAALPEICTTRGLCIQLLGKSSRSCFGWAFSFLAKGQEKWSLVRLVRQGPAVFGQRLQAPVRRCEGCHHFLQMRLQGSIHMARPTWGDIEDPLSAPSSDHQNFVRPRCCGAAVLWFKVFHSSDSSIVVTPVLLLHRCHEQPSAHLHQSE
jgi:hypothetical protein